MGHPVAQRALKPQRLGRLRAPFFVAGYCLPFAERRSPHGSADDFLSGTLRIVASYALSSAFCRSSCSRVGGAACGTIGTLRLDCGALPLLELDCAAAVPAISTTATLAQTNLASIDCSSPTRVTPDASRAHFSAAT